MATGGERAGGVSIASTVYTAEASVGAVPVVCARPPNYKAALGLLFLSPLYSSLAPGSRCRWRAETAETGIRGRPPLSVSYACCIYVQIKRMFHEISMNAALEECFQPLNIP